MKSITSEQLFKRTDHSLKYLIEKEKKKKKSTQEYLKIAFRYGSVGANSGWKSIEGQSSSGPLVVILTAHT